MHLQLPYVAIFCLHSVWHLSLEAQLCPLDERGLTLINVHVTHSIILFVT